MSAGAYMRVYARGGTGFSISERRTILDTNTALVILGIWGITIIALVVLIVLRDKP